ncbi:short-chain dehydrogenase [candidate division KSB3 bacterium]|uniref:Short-chain dehydrogenase n=1 Tax=candidate division KSB3 bacterium TaxID=2044937 RepID=A0A2G6E7L8_9BACT|nr:MAG: short-chain dehydrogenase [candidate division KSB3 bacterium]PIE30454.1 MAG: short-chain dehydrogenase [candidate division KSB3 bacterium]
MILDRFSLKGQIGIVTGGGQGLGKAFCTAFAEAGADVVVAECNPETGIQTAKDIETLRRRSRFIQTDVTSKASVEAMVAATVEEFGKVDFMMNNAGIVKWEKAEDVPEEDWLAVINVNLNGVFYGCQAAARQMIKQGGGRIINIASMSGLIVNQPQNQASYNASKAAVIQLTKSLAAEWAPYNIRVNSISPGYMEGPLAGELMKNPDYGPRWMTHTPMNRPGKPEELCGVAVLLASEASRFMTGSNVVIDGGYTSV